MKAVSPIIHKPESAGRTEKVIDYEGREIAYEWNRDGQREAILYPNGKKVAYEYDDFSRLSHLVDEDREIHYRYNADGRLAEKNYSDGITSSYSYNPMGLLSGFIHQKEESILEQYVRYINLIREQYPEHLKHHLKSLYPCDIRHLIRKV